MRPIPAPRIGDSHGLMRAIDSRGRLRMDEFVTEFAAIRAAATARGLQLGEAVFARLAAALACGRHVLIAGPPGSGKTTLALAVAEAAVAAGRAPGLRLVTAGEALGRQVLAAGREGRWLVADELDRAPSDWASAAFLAGHAVTVGSDAVAAPADWRIVATAPAEPAGAGPFLAAAAHAAARRAEAPVDEATLAREVQAAYRL